MILLQLRQIFTFVLSISFLYGDFTFILSNLEKIYSANKPAFLTSYPVLPPTKNVNTSESIFLA